MRRSHATMPMILVAAVALVAPIVIVGCGIQGPRTAEDRKPERAGPVSRQTWESERR